MKFSKMPALIRSSRFMVSSLVMVISIALVGCMKPSPRGTDPNSNFSDPTKSDLNQSAATFFINGEVTGEAIVSKNITGFSIPVEKQFSFRACVQDKRTNETIKGHQFTVIGADAGTITVENGGRSDGSGCVNWTERLAYNGLADSKFIALKRTLAANGMHTGARDLSICINPWDPAESVRDCARRPVPESQLVKASEVPAALKGETPIGEKRERFLWVNDMRVNSTHNPGGAETGMIDFSVSMGPKVLRYNVRGEEDPMPLMDGVFALKFWVVAKTGAGPLNNQCIVLAKSAPSAEMKMVAGRLQEELKMRIQYLSTYGQLELVGEVSPKENNVGLAPYNGIWMLGDQNGLLGMKFGFERPASYKGEPGSFNAKKYVESCIDVSSGINMEKTSLGPVVAPVPAPVVISGPGGTKSSPIPADLLSNECVGANDIPRLFFEDPIAKGFKGGNDLLSCVNKNLPSGITRLEQFEFGLVDVRPEPIMDPLRTETTTERTIKYRVSTRVTNPLAQGAPLRDIEFVVEKSDGSIDPVRTNHQGDLIFTDTVHHVYFAPERYILKVVRLRHASGFTKRLAIVFNPWDNNGFTFARDLRGVPKESVTQVNLVPRPKSELLLTQFQWGAQGFRYEVDNFVNLKMFKQFNLTISPRVLRYSSLTEGRMKNEPLRDGIYLMKVAIQRDYRPMDGDPLEYVTAVRKLVRVASGIINTPVEMAFRDFRILKIRSNLMIEIATIDESKLSPEQRKTLLVKGDLDPLIDKSSGLAARTFIGPVVAYSNGFSASMRPTDDLSESYCNTIDCDELKKNDRIPPSELSDSAKFFGSIRHLANKSVSDMIVRWDRLERKYLREMTENAKLSKLLKEGNFEYAAVSNESKILVQDPLLKANNQVLSPGRAYSDLMSRISSIDPRSSFKDSAMSPVATMFRGMNGQGQVTSGSVQQTLFGKAPISKELAARLCVVFVEGIVLQRNAKIEESYGYLDRVQAQSRRLQLNEECLREVIAVGGQPKDGSEGVFALEHKLRVFNLTDSERRGGNLMFLGVGAGSSYGLSKGASFSYSFSPTSAASGVLKAAGLTAAEKFLDVLGLSASFSRSDSQSMGEDLGVNVGQSVAVELRGMRMTLGEYERCSSIRFSQKFVESHFGYFRAALPSKMPLAQKLERMGRGLFICEGVVNKKPLVVDERYYQFSQPIGDEALNDPTALENHPYLMTLRSRADYARFVRLVEARPKSFSDLPKHINIGEMPVDRLMGVFKTATPSFTGVVTLEPDSIVQAPVIKQEHR